MALALRNLLGLAERETEPDTYIEMISVKYDPQPDITAYELALLLPAMSTAFAWTNEGNFATKIYKSPLDWWTNLDQSLQRHLKRMS
jgi:hypothetical protein